MEPLAISQESLRSWGCHSLRSILRQYDITLDGSVALGTVLPSLGGRSVLGTSRREYVYVVLSVSRGFVAPQDHPGVRTH